VWPRRRQKQDFNETVYQVMANGMQRFIDAGKSADEAADLVSDAAMVAFDRTAPILVERLVDRAPRMLREHRRIARRYERAVRRDWGRVLDLYYMVWVSEEEVGSEFQRIHGNSAAERQDYLLDALVGIHARACRIALEVHHLLCGGFPMGALARCRTLHELSVTAFVLAGHGDREEHTDLAERYLLHEVVLAASDAQTYQENSAALGHEPLTAADMAALEEQRTDLITRFGVPFRSPYGWAARLFNDTSPTFRQLGRV
jgi:Family of unknown function (DUF5677)